MENSERHIVWLNPTSTRQKAVKFWRKRWVRRTFYSMVGAFVLLVSAGFVIVYCYEDELKEMAINQVKANLDTEMTIGDMDVTFWKRFPHISLNLQNVTIEETFETRDTLIYAEDVFLEFNLFDVLTGDYVVKEVSLDNSFVDLKRDAEGNDNYHFWKVTEGGNDSLAFALDQVVIENCDITYDDLRSEVFVSSHADHLDFAGLFTSAVFELDVATDMFINDLKVGELSYANNQQMSAEMLMVINLVDKSYQFKEALLNIEGVGVVADARFTEGENGVLMSLTCAGENIDIENLVAQLPAHISKPISAYGTRGDVNLSGNVSGMAGSGLVPDVTIGFEIEDGEFLHHGSGVAINRINSKGTFERLKDKIDRLMISSCQARMESGSFSVSGNIIGFDHSDWDLSLAGNFNLDDIRKFAELEAMDELDGLVAANVHYTGSFAQLSNVQAKDLKNAKISGQIELEHASFKLKGAPHTFEDITGVLDLRDSDIAIRKFQGGVKGSDFQLTGHFRNVIPYLLIDNEVLALEATFHSDLLDFNPLLTEQGSGSGEYHLYFPDNLNFSLDLNIDHLMFRKFNARNLAGHATLKNQVLSLDPISFLTSDGSFTASASADGRGQEGFSIVCDANMQGIDVNQLFEEFEDFGQDFIQQHHLKGTAHADITFSAWMGSDLDFDGNKIQSQIDIALENGELIELRSMQSIASYIRSNKLIAPLVNEDLLEEKLNHIYFSRVENEIQIKNGVIYVPNMSIASSAMDISAQGSHAFTNAIDYTIGFKVRDVLCRNNETEFGTVEDDGLSNSFFLSMQGTAENPEFGYDRLAHKEKRIADRQAEKQVFKDLIREEIFKKKGDGSAADKSGNEVTIEIDDGEEEEKPKKRRKLKDLLKDDDEDEEVIITIDDDE
jgi:uncharacterized protein involved in outer membrane biogenesis